MTLYKSLPILCCCMLASCTTLKKTPEFSQGLTTAATHKPGQALTSWQLSGAIAAKNNNKGWTASLKWIQPDRNNYQIRLFGPLGGGTILIEKKGSQVTYREGSRTKILTNADELLFQQTGVRLPVNYLRYWVQGLPAPDTATADKSLDSTGHLLQFKQAEYTITYAQYLSIKGLSLPAKIRLESQGMVIKLIIKHWEI